MVPVNYKSQSGSILIEAVLSMLLFFVGLLSLVGLSTQALNQTGQTRARNDASYLAGDLVGEMWVSPSVNITDWKTRVAAVLPSGAADVYLSTCTCGTTCASPVTGAQSVSSTQSVTICIRWSDSKDASVTHSYSTAAQISRN